MADTRITQVGAEVVYVYTPPPIHTRVTQVGAEVVYVATIPEVDTRVTQVGAEVVYVASPYTLPPLQVTVLFV